MPFGLKNIGATYQGMMNRVFQRYLGRLGVIYLDNIIVKNKMDQGNLTSLNEVFAEACKNNLRLNLEKCTFSVRADKCRVVTEMKPPTTKKEIQKLIGIIAALFRFVSKAANISLPFFKILKKGVEFE